jgi:small subunit ribosomal protein S13
MARIAGVDLPKGKRGLIGLTYIYGIGVNVSREILRKANIDENTKVHQWTDENVNEIRRVITDDYRVEGQLRGEVMGNIKRLMDIACFRGLRHRKGLPLRGQRTKTNARTRKGKRKTVANKKKVGK